MLQHCRHAYEIFLYTVWIPSLQWVEQQILTTLLQVPNTEHYPSIFPQHLLGQPTLIQVFCAATEQYVHILSLLCRLTEQQLDEIWAAKFRASIWCSCLTWIGSLFSISVRALISWQVPKCIRNQAIFSVRVTSMLSVLCSLSTLRTAYELVSYQLPPKLQLSVWQNNGICQISFRFGGKCRIDGIVPCLW